MAGLSPAQAVAVAAVVACKTMEAAATMAGCSPRTMNRWMNDAAFTAAVAQARRQVLVGAVDDLRHAAAEAVGALRRIVTDPSVSPAVTVQAAGQILAHAFRGAELVDVIERLDAIEEAAADAPRSN